MEFIRNQRMREGYDPNTRHCIYGLDADLIMLAIATHELRFSVLREQVSHVRNSCRRCGKLGHNARDCTTGLQYFPKVDGSGFSTVCVQEYQFLDIPILKEYLELELKPETDVPFGWDIERAADDFVMLCFFVGNDFLPHLPTLEIREGAIDLLMTLYKQVLPDLGGYLVENGEICFHRLGTLLKKVGPLEDQILKNRIEAEKSKKAFAERKKSQEISKSGELDKSDEWSMLRPNAEQSKEVSVEGEVELLFKKLKSDRFQAVASGEPVDEVKLGTDGWEDRYFRCKFKRSNGAADVEFIKGVASSFLDGMVWVLKYYYQGCIDWEWYFPYHYAPFAKNMADLIDWDNFVTSVAEYGTTKPFTPLQQLMAVLPAESSWCLPKAYANLMTAVDSPIRKYYPEEFEQDMEGLPPGMTWKAVALLPFIDSKELIEQLIPLQEHLSEAEKKRDSRFPSRLYVRKDCGTKVEELILACAETPEKR